MTFEEWLKLGVDEGYCTPQFCLTHAGQPMTNNEEAQWELGDDPCCHMVRLGTPADWDANL